MKPYETNPRNESFENSMDSWIGSLGFVWIWACLKYAYVQIRIRWIRENRLNLWNSGHKSKPGGLDLSRRGLDRDSQSQHQKKVSFDGWENLDTFKKLVSSIEKSRSRLRNLDFVSTPLFSPKSLDRDWEICRDMTFLANLDSLSQSRLVLTVKTPRLTQIESTNPNL